MRHGDLADLNAFLVVADHLSSRAASAQLGATASALSHTISHSIGLAYIFRVYHQRLD
jgi:pyridoxine/pyridoxamine 5'-phosphate oxidase